MTTALNHSHRIAVGPDPSSSGFAYGPLLWYVYVYVYVVVVVEVVCVCVCGGVTSLK